MLSQLHRTYPELFGEWAENVRRAIDSIHHSVVLHNGGAQVPGIVPSPPRPVAALQARKRGLPPPDNSVQVRIVGGTGTVRELGSMPSEPLSGSDEPASGSGES